jgi:hypothetical protein
MTVTLTTWTTFNTGPQVINSHSVLKHLTLPLGRNNGMARFANSNSNFPSKNVWFRKGKQLLPLTTFSCDQGKTGWTTTLKTPGRQLTAAKPGCRWWRRGPTTVITQRIRDPLITIHGILDPWCQQYNYYDHLISCILLWCLFSSHGPKTLWLLLTPSQGFKKIGNPVESFHARRLSCPLLAPRESLVANRSPFIVSNFNLNRRAKTLTT